MLESAKSTIKEIKISGGRTSKGSTHSGDEDDRSKILMLEQKVTKIFSVLFFSFYVILTNHFNL